MKLLTFNTHSLHGDRQEEKLRIFCDEIKQRQPDVIALQEVNQNNHQKADDGDGYIINCNNIIPVRKDNFSLVAIKRLSEENINYYGVYLPIKCGYDRFDEGVSLLLKNQIEDTKTILLSDKDEFTDWHTRKALGVKCDNKWFFSIHTSREDDGFLREWERLKCGVEDLDNVFLMGDFNVPSYKRNGGYEKILSDGFYDCFKAARTKYGFNTISGEIDGWRDTQSNGMRIDYIFSDSPKNVSLSQVIFDQSKKISDHFGVMVELEV